MIRSEFLAGLAGLGGASTVAQVLPITQSLRVAIVAPESGDAASMGRQLVEGARAAVDEINRLRPSYNPYFLLDVHDDRNDVGNATVQANFAANNPEVIAVIGHLSAAPTLAALQTYANANVALIVPTVTDDRVTAQGYRNVFRLPTKDSDEGGLLAAYALKSGSKTPIVVAQDGDYGTTLANGFVRRAGALHVAATSVSFPLEKPDDARVAEQVLAKTPDSVTLAGTVSSMGALLSALHAKGYTGRVLASQGFFDGETVKTYAKDAEGLVVSTNVPYYPLAPTAQRDVMDFQAQYGPLSPVTAYGYAAVQLVQAAAQRMAARNRLTLIRALASSGAFDTITGSYTFGPYGDVVDPNCYFYAVRNGKFEYDHQAHPGGFMLK
jgi:branched-chain amino acid transport system substrate-binding protein